MAIPRKSRSRTQYIVAWVTAPDLRTARQIARGALVARLAACVQLRPGIESHYWWQGRLEKSQEVLLTFKTTAQRAAMLESLVVTLHPYDTPQFVVAPLTGGFGRYLDWIRAETLSTSAKPKPPAARSRARL